MVITEQKKLEEILRFLEGCERVFLLGCGVCAATWGTGGEKETREMAARLAEAGKTCTGWVVTEEATCDVRTTRRLLKQHNAQVEAADALLVLSCGAGVQTVAALVDMPVYPALNTLFLARLQNLSVCDERCRLCGACILAETAAICPVTLCPKGLMNGPCGGYKDGKCEVDRERDCAWVAIYERMEALGWRERFLIIHEPKDWNAARHPGFINKREGAAAGGAR
ncbi:MAG: methylenetetrahydrofolate reductase C-terminal domain-containing protein [Anaerolineae bacterium]|nr:methylenetetrahydrofolate reductase C-terminal domain-containing protein [Anaerolineae bacterium]